MPIPLDLQGSNKVQITRTPQVAPHACCNCGFGGEQEGRYFIDFGIDIEYYGTILICTECFGEVAALVDYDSPAISLKKSDIIGVLTQENSRLREIEAKYNVIMDVVGTIDGNLVKPGFSPTVPGEVVQKKSGKPGRTNKDSAGLVDEVAELIGQSGPSDVRDDASNVQSLDL